MQTTTLLAGSFVALLVADARAQPVVLTEKPGHVTEVVVTVDASPAEIYALVTNYARWPSVLTDVSSVKVEAGGARDARVRFRSKALGHEVAVVFDNDPDRAIRFHSVDAPPGAHARGDYLLAPLDGGKRTQVTASFYLDVSWPTSWMISSSTVRGMRRAKLERDTTDVVRWFASARLSASAP
jgi:uncharacterized membrane protein